MADASTDCEHEKPMIIIQDGEEQVVCPICKDITVQTFDRNK